MIKQSTKLQKRTVARWLAPAIVALSLSVPLSASADHRRDGWELLTGVAIGYAINDARHDRYRGPRYRDYRHRDYYGYRRGPRHFHARHRGWRGCDYGHFYGSQRRGRHIVNYNRGFYYDNYGYRYDNRGRYVGQVYKRRHKHRH